MIKELIVVEGKNDAAAVRRAFPGADVMITHGWGLSSEQIKAAQVANRRRGVIILTDPDHAGEMIRRRLAKFLPGCKHAFVPRAKAIRRGKVGVEAASVEAVFQALSQVRTEGKDEELFTMEDMIAWGLAGADGASERRRNLGALLSIGYANGKAFLWRLNALGVTRTEFEEALARMEDCSDGCNKT